MITGRTPHSEDYIYKASVLKDFEINDFGQKVCINFFIYNNDCQSLAITFFDKSVLQDKLIYKSKMRKAACLIS